MEYVAGGALTLLAAGAAGGYRWWATADPAQKQLLSVGATVYADKCKRLLLGDVDEHPSVISVEVSLFCRTAGGKAVARTLDSIATTREFIAFLDGGPVDGILLEDLLGAGRFSGVPKYARLEAGSEIVLRYRAVPGSPKAYAVLFGHKDPIRFPPVRDPPTGLAAALLPRIVGAVVVSVEPREVRDVSDAIVEFAGPASDFYASEGLSPTTLDRMLWDVPDRFRLLCLTDSLGRQFAYDRRTTVEIRFPDASGTTE